MPPVRPTCRVRSVLRVIQREVGDVTPNVADPADRRREEDDEARAHEPPRDRQRDDGGRERGRVDERQHARLRHVDLLADRRNPRELALVAHSTYSRAAMNVSANISSPMTAVMR